MEITAAMVKELREETGAGVLDCRQALVETNGDLKAAAEILREKGVAEVAKRADRAALEGVIEVYEHPGKRVGVMLELNCETDFVARTDDFQSLAHDLALHIAFAAPQYVTRDDVPPDEVNAQKETSRAEALEEGKPEHILDRIVEGKLEKYFRSVCLLEQPFVKDEDLTIENILQNHVARLGENIIVRRIARFELEESPAG